MRRSLLLCLAAFALTGCDPVGTAPPVVGGDVDAHGCKPSAGYQWCAKTNQCERPWELAKAQGFENTSEAYSKFCG